VKIKPGPTGKFPDGKIHPTDKGEFAFRISVDQGRVAIDFFEPISWTAFDPDHARKFALILLKAADKADGKNLMSGG